MLDNTKHVHHVLNTDLRQRVFRGYLLHMCIITTFLMCFIHFLYIDKLIHKTYDRHDVGRLEVRAYNSFVHKTSFIFILNQRISFEMFTSQYSRIIFPCQCPVSSNKQGQRMCTHEFPFSA